MYATYSSIRPLTGLEAFERHVETKTGLSATAATTARTRNQTGNPRRAKVHVLAGDDGRFALSYRKIS
jgi:hypothetical protein